MAEVTGDIGGQSVELNNAATEATLKQLLQTTIAMAQKMGVDVKKQADMEKEMKKFFDQLDKSNKGLKDSRKLREDEAKALEKAAAAKKREQELAQKAEMVTVGLYRGLNVAAESAMAFANKLTGVMSSFANMGSSLTGAASTFNNIPIIGGMLANVFGAVATSSEKLQASFKTASSVGATFGGSIRQMVANASQAGLTFEQFSNVIRNNSEDLARLGGTTTEGAKRLAGLSKSLKQTGLQDDLARLGFTSEDIANGMASVTGRLYRGIGVRAGQEGEAAKVGANYLKNLTAISAITGKNREEMEKEAAQRMSDSKYRAMFAKLDSKSRAEMELLMDSLPPGLQKGVREIIATGTAQSDEAQAVMYMYGDIAQSAMGMHQSIRRTNQVTQEQRLAFDDTLRATAKAQDKALKAGTGAITTQMTYVGGVAGDLGVEMQNVAEQSGNVRQSQEKLNKDLKDGAEAAKEHKDSLDPAQIVRMQQEIAKTSNEFNILLAQYLPKLQEAFTMLANFVKEYLVPAFDFFMKYLKEAVIVIGGLIVVLTAIKKVAEAIQAYKTFKELGKERGSPVNPMYTIDAGKGGGPATPESPEDRRKRREGQRDKLKSAKTAGRLVKGVAGLGAVVSAGMLYSDISDINEREQAGDISAEQAKMEKGGAVGSAAGGTGGAVGGAIAGAAIGSVVPVIGTAIGGVIGAALGGWIGSNLGEQLGTAVAKPTMTPEWMKVNGPNIKAWADAVAKGAYKFEQVPDIYKGHVKDLLDKRGSGGATPPVSATAGSPKLNESVPAAPAKKEEAKPAKDAKAADKSAAPKKDDKKAEDPRINFNTNAESLLTSFAEKEGTLGEIKTYKKEELDKLNRELQKSNNKTDTSSSSGQIKSPTNQKIDDSKQKMVNEMLKEGDANAQKLKEAESERDKAMRKALEEDTLLPGQISPSSQISSLDLLAELNSNMSQLVKISKEQKDINERQLNATRGLTNDLFASV